MLFKNNSAWGFKKKKVHISYLKQDNLLLFDPV